MRKVVCNTTPILSLLKLGRLHLLKNIYEEIIIPHAVYDEIEVGKNWEYYTDLSKEIWVTIKDINNTGTLEYFLDLDRGEAEVIILAKEIKADLVILDETLGRRYAKQFDLTLTGTVGILLKAKQNGLIESVGRLLNELISKGVWLSPKIIQQARELAGETHTI